MIFKETPNFTRAITNLLSDDDYARLQVALLKTPDLGNIIVGSGGIRKIRWAVQGRGKSGGARIIYYWAGQAKTILLLDAYGKSHKEDLTKNELKGLRRVVEQEYE